MSVRSEHTTRLVAPEAQDVAASVVSMALEPPGATWMWKSQSTYAAETSEPRDLTATETSSSSSASPRHKTFSSLVSFRLFGANRWHRRFLRVENTDLVYSRGGDSHTKHISLQSVQNVRLVDRSVMQHCRAPGAFATYGWSLQVKRSMLYFCAETETAREAWVGFLTAVLARRCSSEAGPRRGPPVCSPHPDLTITPSISSYTTITDFSTTHAVSESRASMPRALSSFRATTDTPIVGAAAPCHDKVVVDSSNASAPVVNAATVHALTDVTPAARRDGVVDEQMSACQRRDEVGRGSAPSSSALQKERRTGSAQHGGSTPPWSATSSASETAEENLNDDMTMELSAIERESTQDERDMIHMMSVSSEDSEAGPDAETYALPLSLTPTTTPSLTASFSTHPAHPDRSDAKRGQWTVRGSAPPREQLLTLASEPYLTLSTSRLRAVRNGLHSKDEANDLRLACAVDKIGKRDNVQPRELVVTPRYIYIFARSRVAGFRRTRRLPTTHLVGVLQSSTDTTTVALLVPTFHDIILRFAHDVNERQSANWKGDETAEDDDRADEVGMTMPRDYAVSAAEYLVAHLYRIYTELHLDRPFVLRTVVNLTDWVRRRAQDAPRALEARKEDYMKAATHPTLLPLLRKEANTVVYWSSMVRYVTADLRPVLRALVITDGALYVLFDTMTRVRRRIGLGTVRELQYDSDTQGVLLKLTMAEHDVLFNVQSNKEFVELIRVLRVAVRDLQATDLVCTPSRQLYSHARLGTTVRRATRQSRDAGVPATTKNHHDTFEAEWAARDEPAAKGGESDSGALRPRPPRAETAVRLQQQRDAEPDPVPGAATHDAEDKRVVLMRYDSIDARTPQNKNDEMLRSCYFQYRCVEEGMTEYDMVKALQTSPTPAQQLAGMDHIGLHGDGDDDSAENAVEVYCSAVARVLLAQALPTPIAMKGGRQRDGDVDWGQLGASYVLAIMTSGLALCAPSPASEPADLLQTTARGAKISVSTLIPWQEIFALVCAEEQGVAALGLLSCSSQDRLILLYPSSQFLLRDVVHACVLAYSRSTPTTVAQPVLRVYAAPCGVAHVAHVLRRGEHEPLPTLALRTVTSPHSRLSSCLASSDVLHLALEPNVAEACRRYGDTTVYFTGLAWRFRTATVRRHAERVLPDPMQAMGRENNQLYKSFVLLITDGAVYHCSKGGYEIVRRTALHAITKAYVLASDADTILLIVPDEYDMYFRVEGREVECLRRLQEACASWRDSADARIADLAAGGRSIHASEALSVRVAPHVAALSRRLTRPEGYKFARTATTCREEMQRWHIHALRDALLSMQEALRLAKDTATTASTTHAVVGPTSRGSTAAPAAQLRARWDDVWRRLTQCAANLRARQRHAFRCGLRWGELTAMSHAERFLARQAAMQRIVTAAQDALQIGDATGYATVVARATPGMALFVRAHRPVYDALCARQRSVMRVVRLVAEMRPCIEGTPAMGAEILSVQQSIADLNTTLPTGEAQKASLLLNDYARFVMQRIHVRAAGRREEALRRRGAVSETAPDMCVLLGCAQTTLGLPAPRDPAAAPDTSCSACWTGAAVRRAMRIGAFDLLPHLATLLTTQSCAPHGVSSLPSHGEAEATGRDGAEEVRRETLRRAEEVMARYKSCGEGRRAVRRQARLVLAQDVPRALLGAGRASAVALLANTEAHESMTKSLSTALMGAAEQPDVFAAERCAWAAVRRARGAAASSMRDHRAGPGGDGHDTVVSQERAVVAVTQVCVRQGVGERTARGTVCETLPRRFATRPPLCHTTPPSASVSSTASSRTTSVPHNAVTVNATRSADTIELSSDTVDKAVVEQQDVEQLLRYLVAHADNLSARAVATLRTRWSATARRHRCDAAQLRCALSAYTATSATSRHSHGADLINKPVTRDASEATRAPKSTPHAVSPRGAGDGIADAALHERLDTTHHCPMVSKVTPCAEWLLARLSELDASCERRQRLRVLFAAMTSMLRFEATATCTTDEDEQKDMAGGDARLIISRANPHTRDVVQAWASLFTEPLAQHNMPLLSLLHALAALRDADDGICAIHCQRLCVELDAAATTMTTTVPVTTSFTAASTRRELYCMVFLLQSNGLRQLLEELHAAQPRLVRDAGCLAEATLMDQAAITGLIQLAALQEEHIVWPFSPDAHLSSSSSRVQDKGSEDTARAIPTRGVVAQDSPSVRVRAAQEVAAALRQATRAITTYFTSHTTRYGAGAVGSREGDAHWGNLLDQRVHAEAGWLVRDFVLPALLTLLEAGFGPPPYQSRPASPPEETFWDLLCCYEKLVRQHMHALWEAQFVAAMSHVRTLTDGVSSTSNDAVDTPRVRLLLVECLTQGILFALLEGLFLVRSDGAGNDVVAMQWDSTEGGLWQFYDAEACVLWPSEAPDTRQIVHTLQRLLRLPFRLQLGTFVVRGTV